MTACSAKKPVDFDVPYDVDGTAYTDYNTALSAFSSALHKLGDGKIKCGDAACPPRGGKPFECAAQIEGKLTDLGSVTSYTGPMHALPDGTMTDQWWMVTVGHADANGAPVKTTGKVICRCCPTPPKKAETPKKAGENSDPPKDGAKPNTDK
jgi:hypothetical protein